MKYPPKPAEYIIKSANKLATLWDEPTEAETEWIGMPEYTSNKLEAYKTLVIRFRNEEDYQEFAKIIEQTLTKETKSIWFPKLIPYDHKSDQYIDENEA